ncbi:MAG: hypothetical protein IID45_09790, partial [Planctomycetes bacterium]|nr:hypothetical protein [Planctomycetota bacterium]
MSITKELLKPSEEQANLDFRKIQFDYPKAMRNGKLDRVSQDLIRRGLRYRIHKLSMKSQHSQLHKVRTSLMREIRTAADFQN